VPFQPGGRAALAPSQQHVLAALHRWPGLTSSALAPALGLSPSTIGKMRADFRRSGLWAPWFDLDLRALGVDSVAVLGGLFAGPRAPRPSEAALSQVLAANRIPGVGVLGDGHLLLIALPRTLAATAALEAALLEISPRGSGHPWLARLEVAWFPVQDTAFIDYSRVIPDPAAAKSKGRALRLPVETGPRPPSPRDFSRREHAVLTQLLRQPEASQAAAAEAVRVPLRTFARIKAGLLREGVLRASSRANVLRLGFRYNLAALQRFRTVRSPSRLLQEAFDLTPGSGPLACFLSPNRSAFLAPYKTPDAAQGAARAIQRGAGRRGALSPPLTMLFRYGAVRRVAYGLSGDAASAWILSFAQPPSALPLRPGAQPGALVERDG